MPHGASLEEMALSDLSHATVTTTDNTRDYSQSQPMLDASFSNNESLGEFFENILLPDIENHRQPNPHTGSFTPRDFLNFGNDLIFDLEDADYLFINSLQNDLPEVASHKIDGDIANSPASAVAGAEAFKRSLWCWNPRPHHEAFTGVDALATPESVTGPDEQIPIAPLVCSAVVDQSTRDRLMIMLSHAFQHFQHSATKTPSLSSFPSPKILTELLQLSFVQQILGLDSWIFLDADNSEVPQTILTAALIANGASQSPLPAVHKFGFALQEALRIEMYSLYDSDNSLARDLSMLETQVLGLHMGLWSGQSRKMEIAESFLQPPVTMLRRAGRFRAGCYPLVVVEAADTGGELKAKWMRWKREEAYKRLVFHLFLLDAQASMALLVNPLISEAEMQLPLPVSRKLWSAQTAGEWKAGFPISPSTAPSLADCIHDILNLTSAGDSVDFVLSILAVLHGYWGLIWGFRQLVSLYNSHAIGETTTNRLMITSRQHELSQMLKRFRRNVIGRVEGESRHMIILILELLTMYLHVSMEELQLFAGKEGAEDSRRVFPRLRLWAQEHDSKQSVWSAGQVLKSAKLFAPGSLRNFCAIAVYHASLTLWSYGVVHRAFTTSDGQDLSAFDVFEPFALDGEESERSKRFLLLGQGAPFISSVLEYSINSSITAIPADSAPLTSPTAVMRVCLQVLENNFKVESDNHDANLPPLVANLGILMKDLSTAADFVFR